MIYFDYRVFLIILIILLIVLTTRKEYEKFQQYTNDINLDNDLDIYVINLEIRLRKQQYMESQLNKYNFKYNIFQAIDGSKLNLDALYKSNIIDKEKSLHMMHRYLRRGEIGCYLSHVLIWKKLLDSDKKYFLILEDDAILVNNFKQNLTNLLDDVKDMAWDVLYLNENCYKHFGTDCNGPEYSDKTIRPKRIGYGLYGYIISKSFVEKCFSQIHTDELPSIFPISVAVDTYIDHKSYNKKLICLRSKEILVDYDKKFISDTQNML
jgi:GR25 family glycosyltransferase involved in LPS biosynthesis